MTEPRRDDAVREIGEHLSELDRVLEVPGEPVAAEILRLALAVRQCAERAGAGSMAGVALRLEDAAAAYSAGDLAWTNVVAAMASETVAELRNLVVALTMAGTEEERLRDTSERWDELLQGGAEDEEGAVPVAALFPDGEGPNLLAAPDAEAVREVVPVESLLVRGDDALREALAVLDRVEEMVARVRGELPELEAALEEVVDLVELGRTSPAERG